MTISIRPLTLADEPVLWNMLYHALYVPTGQPLPPRTVLREPGLRRYVEGWGRAGDAGAVAETDDRSVGAAWLRLWQNHNRGYGFVDEATPELSIAVAPERRGVGIGSQLLTHLLQAARPDFTGASLSVQRGNPAAALYRRFGFEVVREEGSSLTMLLRWS